MKTPPYKLIVAFLLLIVAACTSAGPAFASSSASAHKHEQRQMARFANTCGNSYKVKKGDTIDKIAAKCGIDPSLVRAANGGRAKVKVGRTLRFKMAPAPTATPRPRVLFPQVQSPPRQEATQVTPTSTRDEVFPTPAP